MSYKDSIEKFEAIQDFEKISKRILKIKKKATGENIDMFNVTLAYSDEADDDKNTYYSGIGEGDLNNIINATASIMNSSETLKTFILESAKLYLHENTSKEETK